MNKKKLAGIIGSLLIASCGDMESNNKEVDGLVYSPKVYESNNIEVYLKGCVKEDGIIKCGLGEIVTNKVNNESIENGANLNIKLKENLGKNIDYFSITLESTLNKGKVVEDFSSIPNLESNEKEKNIYLGKFRLNDEPYHFYLDINYEDGSTENPYLGLVKFIKAPKLHLYKEPDTSVSKMEDFNIVPTEIIYDMDLDDYILVRSPYNYGESLKLNELKYNKDTEKVKIIKEETLEDWDSKNIGRLYIIELSKCVDNSCNLEVSDIKKVLVVNTLRLDSEKTKENILCLEGDNVFSPVNTDFNNVIKCEFNNNETKKGIITTPYARIDNEGRSDILYLNIIRYNEDRNIVDNVFEDNKYYFPILTSNLLLKVHKQENSQNSAPASVVYIPLDSNKGMVEITQIFSNNYRNGETYINPLYVLYETNRQQNQN